MCVLLIVSVSVVLFPLISLWWLEYQKEQEERREKKIVPLEDVEFVSDKINGFIDEWRADVMEIKNLISCLDHEMDVVNDYIQREKEEW